MEYKILSHINSPDDVKKLNRDQLDTLCREIRDCMINTVSKNGGHLASSLGAVELTVALHTVFNSPCDSILFDVGHQSYAHKLITGRFEAFSTLRQENGISGFMRPKESPHDPFVTGHSSNSISASYGIYKAKALMGQSGYTVTVIGDGALTGGMVYEALNNAGTGKGNFIVVLNDNKMSISRNVGGLARHLTVIRSKSLYHSLKRKTRRVIEKIPFCGEYIADKIFKSKTMLKNAIYKSNIFESMGFSYFGPIDGHNIDALLNIFKIAKNSTRPVFIHTITTKGKGYSLAEHDPSSYHGVSSFDITRGIEKNDKKSYSDICGDTLCKMAEEDSNVVAITAAMTGGTGLKEFSRKYKNRFFDVGIAEEHAATFAAGLASKGIKPYFAVYSSFLQRSYDQIIHDISMSGFPVRLCIDRAGIVGEDGESHQGLFDVAFLSTVPNMTVYSPCGYNELRFQLNRSLSATSPTAIRYPRGCADAEFEATEDDYTVFGEGENLIITYGRISANAKNAAESTENTAFLKLNKVYPLAKELPELISKYKNVFFFEEGIKSGGIAEQLGSALMENSVFVNYRIFAVDDTFVASSSVKSALKKYNLDTDSMIKAVKGEI
ncbi:MAG: 1-deoxy-D-xylulose-5-phosphate synthase [Clostridiales bacterium]|nr:1-deoxy-D-xylulose-5-phosphate synthase [Candidatus Equinaster intestinalis]